jgi:hypothetical protein
MSGREVRLQEMFELVRAFGFDPDDVIERSLSFNGVNVEFMTMPGQVLRSYNVKGMNRTQQAALNALIYPHVIQEEPMNSQPKGACPICRSNGIMFGGDGAALAGHIESEHPVKEVVAALAIQAIRSRPFEDAVPPDKCPAHADTNCDLCSLNPADCADPGGPCSYEDAVKRLHRVNGGPQFGIVYKFGREGDPCPECGGFNGHHNGVIDERPWGTDSRSCSYDPNKPVRN